MFFTGTVSPQRYEYICKKYGFKNDGSQDNEIITKIHRLFLEGIRKETGKSVKHWCVTEKGHTNTRRIHLHGLFYAREGQTKWHVNKTIIRKLDRRIQILWTLCQRKNNKLYIKIHDKKR